MKTAREMRAFFQKIGTVYIGRYYPVQYLNRPYYFDQYFLGSNTVKES